MHEMAYSNEAKLLVYFLVSSLAAFVNSQNDDALNQCLECIPKGWSLQIPDNECKTYLGSTYCGRWGITNGYFIDCKTEFEVVVNGSEADYETCSKDITCAKGCVKGYLRRYRRGCYKSLNKSANELNCVDYTSLHTGGPRGCHNLATKEEGFLDIQDRIDNMTSICPNLFPQERNSPGNVNEPGPDVVIIIASVIGVIVLLVGVMVVGIVCIRKKHSAHEGEEGKFGLSVLSYLKKPEVSTEVKQLIEAYQIPKENISISHHIGTGHFGNIYKGTLSDASGLIVVAIKSLRSTDSNEKDIETFLKEALIMEGFHHPNVLRLIGICWEQGEAPLMILPFMGRGDLHTLIKEQSITYSTGDLMNFSMQIGEGMKYLAANKFIHRDLAARNCLVNDCFLVKVADFGLSRDIYENNFYTSENAGTITALPWKWMAIESIEEGKYTAQSDVWSYGILLWELFTGGSTPYPALGNLTELRENLLSGFRLSKPESCPDELYILMEECWNPQPINRPSFLSIVDLLKAHLAKFENDVSYSYTLEFIIPALSEEEPHTVTASDAVFIDEGYLKAQSVRNSLDYIDHNSVRILSVESANSLLGNTMPAKRTSRQSLEAHVAVAENYSIAPANVMQRSDSDESYLKEPTDFYIEMLESTSTELNNRPRDQVSEEPDYLNAHTCLGLSTLRTDSLTKRKTDVKPVPTPRSTTAENVSDNLS